MHKNRQTPMVSAAAVSFDKQVYSQSLANSDTSQGRDALTQYFTDLFSTETLADVAQVDAPEGGARQKK